MLNLEIEGDRVCLRDPALICADRPYSFVVEGRRDGGETVRTVLSDRTREGDSGLLMERGRFAELDLRLERRLRLLEQGIEERMTLRNAGAAAVSLSRLDIGFSAGLANRDGWRLRAVPFRVQLDGSRHDYGVAELVAGTFHNPAYRDPTRPEPPLTEDGILRSEAWAWGTDEAGLVIMKYDNRAVELSVAAPFEADGEWRLRFGGAGFCLYGEPSGARRLEPGESYTFGETSYVPYCGGWQNAFGVYRNFLDEHGHRFPVDYDPPVNWNELYDVGWYHSDAEKLAQNYTRDALRKEAEKARACGCDLLYLDPGWEVAEGMTRWDEKRLGPVGDLIEELHRDYGLDLGYRTILRCYRDHWPHRYMVKHPDQPVAPTDFGWGALAWEPCLCGEEFRSEKRDRILAISKHGVRFMMVDEMDWRGPCYDPAHGHRTPTTPLDHIRAVYGLCADIRRHCPGLTIEAHDPVWPWNTSLYAPTYFRQGFGDGGDYDENWGFEYMWNCLEDLRTGKALALYYYALSCNIPLYLHITMAADNEHCVFFWWAASTVRHLGIGGKTSDPSVEASGPLARHDPETRFADYREQMRIYNRLRPYFVRGRFEGLSETAHLHTLPGREGAVLVLFNLDEGSRIVTAEVPRAMLGSDAEMRVTGANAVYNRQALRLSATLPAMAPAVVCIGDAVDQSGGSGSSG